MELVGIVLFFVTSFLVGWNVWQLLRIDTPSKTLVQFVLGILTLTSVFFGLGIVLHFTKPVIFSVLLFLLLTQIILVFPSGKKLLAELGRFRIQLKRNILSVLSLMLLALWLFGRALYFNETGALVAGDRLVWTDWPVHIGIVSNFAWGQNWPPQNPTFAGNPLIYPFMTDFLSAIFLVLSQNLIWALFFAGFVLCLCFLGLYLVFANTMYTSDTTNRKKVGLVALILSLFWGGLGWWYWLQEVFASETSIVSNLMYPAREYTFWQEKNFWFFTFLYSEILPQRAILFGLPIFFLILLLVKTGWEKENGHTYFLLAGVLAGILPFFHSHTFLALWILSIALFIVGLIGQIGRHRSNKNTLKKLLAVCAFYFIPLAVLSAVQAPLLLSQSQGLPFEFGWMKGSENFFLFWFKNTGLFIPLAIYGLWRGKFNNFAKTLGIASWSLFIMPNLFRFAPWGYDNLKIFTYWYLIQAIFVAVALFRIGRMKLIGRIGAILLFLTLTLSGVVEVGRLWNTPQISIQLWSKSDQEFAKEVREKTEPQSVFLTAAVHDHPVVTLAGRKSLLGFPGNSWSWGIKDWSQREQDVHTMYQGGDKAKSLWKKYGVEYIVVGEKERWFEPKLDEAFIASNTSLAFEYSGTKVYKVE